MEFVLGGLGAAIGINSLAVRFAFRPNLKTMALTEKIVGNGPVLQMFGTIGG